MQACNLIDKTKSNEPKLYYRSQSGSISQDLQQTLQNSSDYFEFGFMTPSGEFMLRGQSPIFDKSTIKGAVQSYIKNGFLKSTLEDPNIFQAVDDLAKLIVEDDLFLNHYGEFRSLPDGKFQFGDFSPKNSLKSSDSIPAKVNDIIEDYVAKKNELNNEDNGVYTPQYSEEELKSSILSFMTDMGFSFESIERYNQKGFLKNGVEPSADALVDLQNKIIAFSNGEIKTSELTEEFSHFLVEAWDQSEIDRMLQQVQNTEMYSRVAEQYRAIYSNQLSDPEIIEQAVKREVLGKMLAEAIQNSFNTENKSELESNFWTKFKEIFERFFRFISAKKTTELEEQINDMAKDVSQRLLNNELQNKLNTEEYDPIVKVMYKARSINPESIKDVQKVLKGIDSNLKGKPSEVENEIRGLQNNTLQLAVDTLAVLQQMNDGDIPTSDIDNAVPRLQAFGELSQTITALVENMPSDELYERLGEQGPILKKSIVDKNQEIQSVISNVTRRYNHLTSSHDIEDVFLENYKKLTGHSDGQDVWNSTEIAKTGVQKDTNWFWKLFGHTGKFSNPLVALFNKLIGNMRSFFTQEFNDDIDAFIKPLVAIKDNIKNYIKKGRIMDGINHELLEKERGTFELELLSEVYGGKYSNMTLEEYQQLLKDNHNKVPELEVIDNDYYKYKLLYSNKMVAQGSRWANSDVVDYHASFINDLNIFKRKLPNVIGDNRELWEYPIVQDLITQRENPEKIDSYSRREKANPFTPDGFLKSGLLTKVWGFESDYDMFHQEQTFASTNPNVVFDNPSDPNSPKKGELVFFASNLKSRITTNSDGELAYHYMIWNSIQAQGRKNISNKKGHEGLTGRQHTLYNYIQSYKDFVKNLDRKGIKDEAKKREISEWFKKNTNITITDDYYEKTSGENYGLDLKGIERFLKDIDPQLVDVFLSNLEHIRLASARRSMFLKKFKDPQDYKEININAMTPADKAEIDKMSFEISELNKQLKSFLIDKGMSENEIYLKGSDNNFVQRLNKSFRNLILAQTGRSFEEGFASDIEFLFFRESISGNLKSRYNAYKKRLQGLLPTEGRRVVRDVLFKDEFFKDDLTLEIDKARLNGFDITENMSKDEIKNILLKNFLLENAPMWVKRYDVNTEYDEFSNKLQRNELDVETYLNSKIRQIEHDTKMRRDTDLTVSMNGITLSNMTLSPHIKFSRESSRPSVESLIYDYKQALNKDEKIAILKKLTGEQYVSDNIRTGELDKLSENQKDELLLIWDAQIQRLEKDFHDEVNDIPQRYVSIAPQLRKTNLDRTKGLITNFNVLSLKDWAQEEFSFREDDFEYSYEEHKIPRYGYAILDESEKSDDYLYAFAWGIRNANQRKQRVIHRNDAMKIIRAFEQSKFENNKDPKSTNYYDILKESLDYNFYGKTSSLHIKWEIPFITNNGKPIVIDFAKILHFLRGLTVKTALAFSPIVASTNFLGGVFNNAKMHFINHDIYGKSNTRAGLELGRIIWNGASDVGQVIHESRLNKIFYQFGGHDVLHRFEDSDKPRVLRLMRDSGFSFMSLTNYPLETQSVLSKLMEYRLIDGEFVNWKQFKKAEFTKNPDQSDSDLKAKFDSYEEQSMYDFLDEDGHFDQDKLKDAGYKGDIKLDKAIVMGDIRSITERTTMEISDINQGQAMRNPMWSFLVSMKKWMIIATHDMFGSKRYDFDTGDTDIGMLQGAGEWIDMVLQNYKKGSDAESLKELYDKAQPYQKTVLKRIGWTGAMTTVALGLAYLLKGLADDDDEKDNYALQFLAYMAIRNLNEVSSAGIGLPESYYESIKQPIMAASSLKTYSNIFKIWDIDDEIKHGKYKGMNKYAVNIMKATSLKNMYIFTADGSFVKETRDAYVHFNTDDGIYSLMSLLPEKPKK